MNKPVQLGLSIPALSKIFMFDFWHNYVKSQYGENTKLCYINTDSFIVCIKTDNIYKDIAEGVETIFDTSNNKLVRLLTK